MLTITPTNDKNLLDDLSIKIFGKKFCGDVGFVLYNGNKPSGIAKISCREEFSAIIFIGVLPEFRKEKLGDFFTRSILLRMSEVSDKIEINYVSDYYKKFGFKEENGKMIIESDKLYFPCECKKGV